MSEIPEWVQVWAWYRRTHGNHGRPFPQQLEAREFRWEGEPVDYEAALRGWRGSGSDAEAFLDFLVGKAA